MKNRIEKSKISIISTLIFLTLATTVFGQGNNQSLEKVSEKFRIDSLYATNTGYNEKRVLLRFIISMVNSDKTGYDDALNTNPYFLFNQGLIGEEIIDEFIKNTQNINQKIYGFTPIMIALIKQDYNSMKKLLKAGADPYINFSRTEYYSITDDIENTIARNLIVHAYNRMKVLGNGEKIFVSAYVEHVPVYNISFKDYEKEIFGEMSNMINYLDPLYTVSKYKRNDIAFVKACRLYHWDKVNELLAKGVSINATDAFGATALLDVLINKDYGDEPVKKRKMVKFLIENGADVVVENYQGVNSFLEAYDNYRSSLPEYKEINKEIYEMILPKALQYEDMAILLVATKYKTFMETIEAHPEIDLNYKDPETGKTALYESITRQDYEITKELLNRGLKLSDISLKPLSYVIEYMNYFRPKTLEWVKLMTENGSDVNGSISNGDRLLEKAYREDKYEIFKYLFEHGADVNLLPNVNYGKVTIFESFLFNEKAKRYYELTKSKGKITVNAAQVYICQAVKENNLEMVKLFIELGVDLQEKDWSDKTPIKYAESKEMKNLLKNK